MRLFVSPDVLRLRYSNFNQRIWFPATKRSGLDGLKIQDLGKTTITNLVKAGVDLKTVTVLVGHEDIRTRFKHYPKKSLEQPRGVSSPCAGCRYESLFRGTHLCVNRTVRSWIPWLSNLWMQRSKSSGDILFQNKMDNYVNVVSLGWQTIQEFL